jgi:DNA-binding transcriptional regulator YiaG
MNYTIDFIFHIKDGEKMDNQSLKIAKEILDYLEEDENETKNENVECAVEIVKRKEKMLTKDKFVEIRKTFHLSQNLFAKLIGIGVASIRRYELGELSPASTQLVIYTLLKNEPRLIKYFWDINCNNFTDKERKKVSIALSHYIMEV